MYLLGDNFQRSNLSQHFKICIMFKLFENIQYVRPTNILHAGLHTMV